MIYGEKVEIPYGRSQGQRRKREAKLTARQAEYDTMMARTPWSQIAMNPEGYHRPGSVNK